MEVSISQFRRNLFDLVGQAMEGTEVWVVHKGQRFRIAPEFESASRLSRITPMKILTPGTQAVGSLQQEMEQAWEKDWSTL
jgi:hypothetical protein